MDITHTSRMARRFLDHPMELALRSPITSSIMVVKNLQVTFVVGLLYLSAGACGAFLSVASRPGYCASPVHGDQDNSDQTKGRFEFEVATVRLHKPGSDLEPRRLTPDGYHTSMTLLTMIQDAYNPQSGKYRAWSQIDNAPEWAKDTYDIDGRVAEKDMAAWKTAQLDDQFFRDPDLERSALRAILKSHFKLVLITKPIQTPYLDLVVGRNGPKLTPSVTGALSRVHSRVIKLGNGFYIQYSDKLQCGGVTMKDLAYLLTRFSSDYPVQDKTNFPGEYDFTLPLNYSQRDPDSQSTDLLETTPLNKMIPLETIGLTLKRGTGPAFIFNIKHIEKPSVD